MGWRWGWGVYNWSTTISTKLCCFVFVRAIHAKKTKTAWKMSLSFDPFQLYTRKILYPRYFSGVACTPSKAIKHMTSDFEVHLDMQMSFLNAAPWSMKVSKSYNTEPARRPTLCVDITRTNTAKTSSSLGIVWKWNSQTFTTMTRHRARHWVRLLPIDVFQPNSYDNEPTQRPSPSKTATRRCISAKLLRQWTDTEAVTE